MMTHVNDRKAGRGKVRVGAIVVIEVPEDALTRRVSQHRRSHSGTGAADILVPQGEEKRLVLYDRTAAAHGVLVCISPINRRGAWLSRQWIPINIVQPA